MDAIAIVAEGCVLFPEHGIYGLAGCRACGSLASWSGDTQKSLSSPAEHKSPSPTEVRGRRLAVVAAEVPVKASVGENFQARRARLARVLRSHICTCSGSSGSAGCQATVGLECGIQCNGNPLSPTLLRPMQEPMQRSCRCRCRILKQKHPKSDGRNINLTRLLAVEDLTSPERAGGLG